MDNISGDSIEFYGTTKDYLYLWEQTQSGLRHWRNQCITGITRYNLVKTRYNNGLLSRVPEGVSSTNRLPNYSLHARK